MNRTILIVESIVTDARRFESAIRSSAIASRYHIVNVRSVEQAKVAIQQLRETIAIIVCDVNAPMPITSPISSKYGASDHLRQFVASLDLSIPIISTAGRDSGINPSSGELYFHKGNESHFIQMMMALQSNSGINPKPSDSGEKIAALNERAKSFVTQDELNQLIYGGRDRPQGMLDILEEMQTDLSTIKEDMETIKALIAVGRMAKRLGISRYIVPLLAAIAGALGLTEGIHILLEFLQGDE